MPSGDTEIKNNTSHPCNYRNPKYYHKHHNLQARENLSKYNDCSYHNADRRKRLRITNATCTKFCSKLLSFCFQGAGYDSVCDLVLDTSALSGYNICMVSLIVLSCTLLIAELLFIIQLSVFGASIEYHVQTRFFNVPQFDTSNLKTRRQVHQSLLMAYPSLSQAQADIDMAMDIDIDIGNDFHIHRQQCITSDFYLCSLQEFQPQATQISYNAIDTTTTATIDFNVSGILSTHQKQNHHNRNHNHNHDHAIEQRRRISNRLELNDIFPLFVKFCRFFFEFPFAYLFVKNILSFLSILFSVFYPEFARKLFVLLFAVSTIITTCMTFCDPSFYLYSSYHQSRILILKKTIFSYFSRNSRFFLISLSFCQYLIAVFLYLKIAGLYVLALIAAITIFLLFIPLGDQFYQGAWPSTFNLIFSNASCNLVILSITSLASVVALLVLLNYHFSNTNHNKKTTDNSPDPQKQEPEPEQEEQEQDQDQDQEEERYKGIKKNKHHINGPQFTKARKTAKQAILNSHKIRNSSSSNSNNNNHKVYSLLNGKLLLSNSSNNAKRNLQALRYRKQVSRTFQGLNVNVNGEKSNTEHKKRIVLADGTIVKCECVTCLIRRETRRVKHIQRQDKMKVRLQSMGNFLSDCENLNYNIIGNAFSKLHKGTKIKQKTKDKFSQVNENNTNKSDLYWLNPFEF